MDNGNFREAYTKLLKANEKLMAWVAISDHRAKGFEETLKYKTKANRKGRKLDLKGEASGGASIWSAVEVKKANEFQQAKDLGAQAKKDGIAERKTLKEANKAAEYPKKGRRPPVKQVVEESDDEGGDFSLEEIIGLGAAVEAPSTSKKQKKLPVMNKTSLLELYAS